MSERELIAAKIKLAAFLLLAVIDTVILVRWPT